MELSFYLLLLFAVLFAWSAAGCWLGVVRFRYAPLAILGAGYAVKKGKDGMMIENVTTVFASSNHADAAVFGESDRRYDVISTSAPMMPAELVKRVRSLIEQQPGALLWLVLEYGKGADNFNPDIAPPQTAAKKSMMESGRAVWAQRMRDAFEAREWPFTGDIVAVSNVSSTMLLKT